MRTDTTHLAYADETHYNTGRYRGIALVSIAVANANEVALEIQKSMAESNITEFKWEKLRSAKYRFGAISLVDSLMAFTARRTLRIDVVIWDIEDSRHKIRARDDIANLQRMYYHLFKNVLRARWPDDSRWCLHPDEQTALDWESVGDFLATASTRFNTTPDLFSRNKFSARLQRDFSVQQIKPCRSCDEPLIQLADFLAGLAVYSRTNFDGYERWQRQQGPQLSFLPVEQEPSLSNSDRERYRVLGHFDRECKARKLGVSLRTHRGLRTFDGCNPINFWWYEPQHELDKAPTLSSGRASPAV